MDFDHYQQQQQLLSHITAHTASSTKKLEARLLQWSMSTEKEVASDLDLIHSILKHERACGSSLSSACAARIFYPQLAQLVIDQTNDKKTTLSYSLLVCMIDLVKHDSLTPSQSMHFIAMASSLWSHHKIYTCRKSMELCCRLVSRMPSIEGTFIDRIVAYIRQCRTHMTRLDVDKIRSPDYTEFFFEDTPSSSAMVYDRSTIRWLIQTTFAVLLKQGVDSLGRLMTEIKGKEALVAMQNVAQQRFRRLVQEHGYSWREGTPVWRLLCQRRWYCPASRHHSLHIPTTTTAKCSIFVNNRHQSS